MVSLALGWEPPTTSEGFRNLHGEHTPSRSNHSPLGQKHRLSLLGCDPADPPKPDPGSSDSGFSAHASFISAKVLIFFSSMLLLNSIVR